MTITPKKVKTNKQEKTEEQKTLKKQRKLWFSIRKSARKRRRGF